MEHTLTVAIYAVLIAFAICVVLSPALIHFLIRLKVGQQVRDDGPKTHLKKSGTPTMGGIMIISAFIAASIPFCRDNPDGAVVMLVTAGFGLIGFLDDYIKVTRRKSEGLNPKQKMLGQILIMLAFCIYIHLFTDTGTQLLVPFTEGITFDLGILYYPFLFFVILGTVNGVNFTDGLDGLASGVTVLIAAFFMLCAWAVGSGITPIAGAAVGSLLGFLLLNSYPAKVIMGDTGSLALGGFVAATAILLKMPLFILIVGLIYVAEVLSVAIQVSYFKLTKGRRIFKMAPIHHHFELSGMAETKVVALFYIITALMCLVGFLGAQNIF